MKRREFIVAGVAGAVGVVSGCATDQTTSTQAPPAPIRLKFKAVARFSGLFGLVAAPDYSRAEVLFVNAAKVGLPAHIPVLKVHLDNVASGTPDREDDYDPAVGIWDLNQSQVTFSVTGALTPAPHAQGDCPKTAADWRDPRWIASLSSILGAGKAKADPNLIKPGDLSATIVSTRIPLAAGIVGGALPRYVAARNVKLAMVNAPSVPPSAITDLVEVEMPDLDDLSITITPYAAGAGTKTVTLAAGSSGRPAYVWFENNTDPSSIAMPHHFRALYSLISSTYTGVRPEPGNAVYCDTAQKGAAPDFPNYCPPATLEY